MTPLENLRLHTELGWRSHSLSLADGQSIITDFDALRTIAAQLAEALGKRQWVGVGACACGGIKDGIPHRTGCDAGDALEAWEAFRDH